MMIEITTTRTADFNNVLSVFNQVDYVNIVEVNGETVLVDSYNLDNIYFLLSCIKFQGTYGIKEVKPGLLFKLKQKIKGE